MNTLCRPASIRADRRVARLPHSQHRIFTNLVDVAAGQDEWGVVPAPSADLSDLAWDLRVHSVKYLERVLGRLAELGLVQREGDDLLLTHFFPDEAEATAPAHTPTFNTGRTENTVVDTPRAQGTQGGQGTRPLSNTPEAIRQRRYQKKRRAAQAAGVEGEALGSGVSPNVLDTQNITLPAENITPDITLGEAKHNAPHNALALGSGVSPNVINVQRSPENQSKIDNVLTLNVIPNVSDAREPNAPPNAQDNAELHASPPKPHALNEKNVNGRKPHAPAAPPDQRRRVLTPQVLALAEELGPGNEARDFQLLGLCDDHNLTDLVRQALEATRHRQTYGTPVGSLHAYFDKTLVKMLANHQVFVPKKADKQAMAADMGLPEGASADDVRAALVASLPPESFLPPEPEPVDRPAQAALPPLVPPAPARRTGEGRAGHSPLAPAAGGGLGALPLPTRAGLEGVEQEALRQRQANLRRDEEAETRRQREAAR